LMNSSRSIPDDGPAPSSATSEGGIMYDKGVPVEADGPAEVDATTVDEPNPDTAGEVPDEVPDADASDIIIYADPRSEERRVGKEGRSVWWRRSYRREGDTDT